jgi:hypothetical protein
MLKLYQSFCLAPETLSKMFSLSHRPRNSSIEERAECQELLAWSEEDEEAFEAALEEIKTRTTALKAEKKKLLMRTRKYRLYPTRQQKKTLRQFFGTCRWTYN